MMDWGSSLIHDEYTYRRIIWAPGTSDHMAEAETLANIRDGGTISENYESSVKSSATIPYMGGFTIGKDLMRIYKTSSLGDETVTDALGTFLPSKPTATLSEFGETGSINMLSMLSVAADDAPDNTYAALAGTNPVTVAASILTDLGLTVISTPYDGVLAGDHVFETDKCWLTILNELLGFANYDSAGVDGFGNILLRPYVSPADRQPVWTFRSGSYSILARDVEREYDISAVPNYVKVVCSRADAEPIIGIARNDDPMSPFSTISRGRRITRTEQVDEIDTQAAADAKAKSLLDAGASNVEKHTIRHLWAPVGIEDVVRLDYPGAGIDTVGSIVSRELTLLPGTQATSVVRRYVSGLGA